MPWRHILTRVLTCLTSSSRTHSRTRELIPAGDHRPVPVSPAQGWATSPKHRLHHLHGHQAKCGPFGPRSRGTCRNRNRNIYRQQVESVAPTHIPDSGGWITGSRPTTSLNGWKVPLRTTPHVVGRFSQGLPYDHQHLRFGINFTELLVSASMPRRAPISRD